MARNVVGKAHGAHLASRKLFQLVSIVQRHMVLFLYLHIDGYGGGHMGTAVSISLHRMVQRAQLGSTRCAHLHRLYLRWHVVAALERYLLKFSKVSTLVYLLSKEDF